MAPEPIAIVGTGLRFPGGCESLADFAEFLAEGRSGIRDIPDDRWDVEAFTPRDQEERGKIRTTGGGFLDRIDLFDPAFFNISPKEAQFVDPQQRMLLETAWRALEDAAIDPHSLRRGNGGVYVGASSIDYALELDSLSYADLDGHLAAGITMFPLSGRISYFLGMRGPSVSTDTACSSSLVALHMAMQGLRGGECDIALCGGVNALHHPRIPVMFSHAQMLAPDGRCKTFDESADGYARAEGCAVIVLKRLDDAVRDGDRVLAVVRGTAVGQDGDSAGLTVPNGTAQEIVMRNALRASGVAAEEIQYVEAHGTGTPLGDPIELGAIAEVFSGSHTKDEPLLVGSVKTNLGHMEPASGLVGLLKVVAQLRSGTVYPHLNLTTPSRRIPWDVYPVEVPTATVPWTAPVRRALVSSFGFAGTIAAVVVEQAPRQDTPPRPDQADEHHVLCVSARSSAALTESLTRHRDHLASRTDLDVADLCHTSAVGRAHFAHRVALVAADRDGLLAALDREIAVQDREPGRVSRKTAFVFSGQGAQHAGMGAALYRRFPLFAERVNECDRLFGGLLGESVRDLLLGTHPDPTLIDRTRLTQPCLFTMEYALAALWTAAGVRPTILIGHSIGEVVAAAVAGLFTLPDAVRLVAARAELMESVTESGHMAAVSAPVERVAPMLAEWPRLAVAAVNAPDQCVLSGASAQLRELTGLLRDGGVRVEELTVSHAFHSPLMAEVYDRFACAIADIEFHEPSIPLVSNVTGRVARRAEISTPEYWVRHIGEPVLFMAGIRTVAGRGRHTFVEIGPSASLTALAQRSVAADEHLWVASRRRRDTDAATMVRSMARLHAAGASVDWRAVHAGRPGRRVELPPYPFQRKRYWLPTSSEPSAGPVTAGQHPLLGRAVAADGHREFTARCSAGRPHYLAGHHVDGRPGLPAAAFAEVLFAAQDAVLGHTGHALAGLRLHEPAHLPDEDAVELCTRLVPGPGDRYDAEVGTRSGDTYVRHATATLVPAGPEVPAFADPGPVLAIVAAEDLYTDLASVGRRPGPAFRVLEDVMVHEGRVLSGAVRTGQHSPVEHLPAEVLEAVFLALSAADRDGVTMRVASVESVRLFRKPRAAVVEFVARRTGDGTDLLLHEAGRPVAQLTGVVMAAAAEPRFVHRLEWVPRAREEAAGRDRHVVVVNGAEHGLDAQPSVAVTPVADVAGLPAALADPGVTDVCWFWRPGDGPMTDERLRAETEQNMRDLLAVVAALAAAPPSQGVRLWLVTSGAHLIGTDTPGDGGGPLSSVMWGFGLVLRNEIPRHRTTLVDLGPDGDAAALLAELRTGGGTEFQLAFRYGDRYVRRVLPVDPAVPAAGARRGVVRPDRTYLVTGGLGGLGLATAARLIDLGARRVALLSRSGRVSEEAGADLDRLRARAEVVVLTGHVTDRADVTRVVTELAGGPLPLGGVVHAAGAVGKALVGDLDWAAVEEQLAPKVYGGWLLHEATRDLPDLDFFVVYSSIAGVVGGLTQAHYAAASTFLDALAVWRDRQGLPGLATSWGAWASVGMSARLDDAMNAEIERGGIRFFSPRRALHTLTDLLAEPVAHRVVGEFDWDRIAAASSARDTFYAEVVSDTVDVAPRADPAVLAAMPPAERTAFVRTTVRTAVAGALHADAPEDVDPHAELVSLGLDSLMAMEVKSRLETRLRLALPASLAFDYPTVELLTKFIDDQLTPEGAR